MSNINKDYIEDYIRMVTPNNTEVLRELEDYAKLNHVPIVHPEVAQLLKVLIKIKGAKRILEIGTAIGYSSIIMAQSMEKDGKVVTIERRQDMVEKAKKNITNLNLQRQIEILEGEANDILPKLNNKFDFIFVDAAKGKYMEYFPYCINLIKDEGVIVSDNVLFKGMVANNDLVIRRKKTIVRRMREYIDKILNDCMLDSCIIPIGDGVAVSYKRRNYSE